MTFIKMVFLNFRLQRRVFLVIFQIIRGSFPRERVKARKKEIFLKDYS